MADVRIVIDPSWPEQLRAEIADVPMKVAEAIAVDARRLCPEDTRELVSTIEPVPLKTSARVYVGGLFGVYWASVEYGSDEHVIESHGKWPLRNKETGQVFGRRVLHPGTPEQPFMRPALYRVRDLGSVMR